MAHRIGCSILLGVVMLCALSGRAEAFAQRIWQIPNGDIYTCANCHLNPRGAGPRNVFGEMVRNGYLTLFGAVKWGPELAALDADGDGATNGQELQDPTGAWRPGEPPPGDPARVTKPWDPTSKPSGPATLIVRFEQMDADLGETFRLRLVDDTSGAAVSQVELDTVATSTFDVRLHGGQVGGLYHIDLYADLNLNGRYDAPPSDHAWRLELGQVTGATVVDFSPQTPFTDVAWDPRPTAVVPRTWAALKRTVGHRLLPWLPAAPGPRE